MIQRKPTTAATWVSTHAQVGQDPCLCLERVIPVEHFAMGMATQRTVILAYTGIQLCGTAN